MFRFLIAVLVLLAASRAQAQCPNGRCPRPVVNRLTNLLPTPRRNNAVTTYRVSPPAGEHSVVRHRESTVVRHYSAHGLKRDRLWIRARSLPRRAAIWVAEHRLLPKVRFRPQRRCR